MGNNDLSGFKIYEGDLLEQDLTVLKALVQEGLEDDTDAYFLFMSVSEKLSAFATR